MRALPILSAVLVASASAEAHAQTKPLPSKVDSGCTTFPDGRVECVKVRGRAHGDALLRRVFYRNDSTMMKRAALGIELRATGTRRDTLGVFVAAVTPRGPAETAGIIEGDRIAAINGVDLRSAAADVDDAYTNGIPSHRLSREVQKLTPGTKVTLRVYSGGRFRDVVVTTGRASEVLRQAGHFNLRVPGPGGGMEFRGPDGAMMFSPQMPLRIERFGPPGPTRIRALPRRTELDVITDVESDLLELEIEPAETEVIRELIAQTARDASEALRKLAAEGAE